MRAYMQLDSHTEMFGRNICFWGKYLICNLTHIRKFPGGNSGVNFPMGKISKLPKTSFRTQGWACDKSWWCASSNPLGNTVHTGLEKSKSIVYPYLYVYLDFWSRNQQALTVSNLPNGAGEITAAVVVTAFEDWSIKSHFYLFGMTFELRYQTQVFNKVYEFLHSCGGEDGQPLLHFACFWNNPGDWHWFGTLGHWL